ncbi:hypothetical protein [Anaeroselena agilis]|uniref:Lipoprotein n=1 Tax=Anaeroselena agilis TaxID=3063788 RepID=A0ABU3P3V9_9FIRM|nr:hypothetical protein [Selenomonadales bacterium 4137-cl]
MKMNKKQFVTAAIIGVFALSTAACSGAAAGRTPAAPQPAAQVEDGKGAATIAAYNTLAGKRGVRAAELLAALDAGIRTVSRNEATAMIVAAEAAQKRDLPGLEEKLAGEGLQRKIGELYRNGIDLDKAGDIGDAELREALIEVRDGGYRLDTAEGMYFPVIDYGRYRQYRGLVTADLAAYIDLMAVESDRAPAKDAALVIGWDEMIRRALAQENFLRTFEDSPRARDVKSLYGRYLSFIFYGANNTPLFAYDNKTMSAEARTAYAAAAGTGDSRLAARLKEYLGLLATKGYRLDAEVEEFRKQAVSDLGD